MCLEQLLYCNLDRVEIRVRVEASDFGWDEIRVKVEF